MDEHEQSEFEQDSIDENASKFLEATADSTASDMVTEKDSFEKLLNRCVTVGLSDDEWAQLAPYMEGNQEAVRRYTEAIHLRELLVDYAGGMPPSKSLLTDLANLDRSIFDESQPEGSLLDESILADNPEISVKDSNLSESSKNQCLNNGLAGSADRTNSVLRNLSRNQIQQTGFDWSNWFNIATAAALALFVGIASGYYLSQSDQTLASGDSNPETLANISSKDVPSFGTELTLSTKESLGRIIGLSPEASSDGLLRCYQVGEELRRGEVVQLASGLMQVGFASGPRAMIEGPAEFSVVGDRGLYVKYGKIKTSAQGSFELQTPMLRIDSKDAEIDVIAIREESTEVYSHKGLAQVHSNSKRRLQDKLLRSLEAGDGIEVKGSSDAEGLLVADTSEPRELVASWQEVNKALHPYEQEVLSDKPLAYWPLHRVQRNRRVLDLSQNGFDGQAVGSWPKELNVANQKQARGAYFDGESYIEPDSKPPVDLKTGFTIESWANVMGGPEFQSIFTSRWVLASNTPHQQCFGFTLYVGDDDRWQFWSGTGNYGADWQMLVAPIKVKRHQWTHVAASFQPYPEDQQPAEAAGQWIEGLVELYVEGEKVAEATHQISLTDFEWPSRIGAAEFVPQSLTSWLFQGELRDVALYDYVVSKDRIKSHAKTGESAS